MSAIIQEIIKVYVGTRRHGECIVSVYYNSASLPLHHICKHSPTGFEWGYAGSGPADLAYSMLHDIAGEDIADRYYQKFKHEKIANLPHIMFIITGYEINVWLEQQDDLQI